MASSPVAQRAWRPVALIAGLSAITVWTFHLQLFEGWSFPWDFVGPYTATPPFVAATFGHGHPMSWAPFVAGGFPVDLDPQAGLYFPGWWLLGALRIPATLGVLTDVQVFHVPLGAVGMLLLARARRLTWPWASLCAVAYLFFGGYYGQAEHADFFRGFSYLPWLLWVLTPPRDTDERWTRLIALPLIAWVVASGAYPGQIVSFSIVGIVYLTAALMVGDSEIWRIHRKTLALAILASVGVCVTILLPHVRAEQAGELFRENEPTAAARATFSFVPLDVFGLYLSNFAWTFEGTITAWVIGTPILIGLALTRMRIIRSHIPLVASGALAFALAITPRIGFVGNAMASLRFLFPSRFPAADYKAMVAIALILISIDAWSRLSSLSTRRLWVVTASASCVLVGGALLVPHTHAQPTRELGLLVAVVIASSALALTRPPVRVLTCALLVLLIVDGAREINDYRLGGVASPWHVPPEELSFYLERDGYVRELPESLERTVATRPARLAPAPQPEPDASGWVADAYHESDYDTTIERVRWRAEHSPEWLPLMLAPWEGFLFPCSTVGCRNGGVHLPPTRTWHPSPSISTTSYSAKGIAYTVAISQPMLFVENELAIKGWHADTTRARVVSAGIPLRAWRLSPGRYRFTATFQEPGRSSQYLALTLALIAWLGCATMLLRARRFKPSI